MSPLKLIGFLLATLLLWMLEGIAHALGPRDRRAVALEAAARWHREAALPQVSGAHYEGGHWLGTFAVYLVSRAGIASGR